MSRENIRLITFGISPLVFLDDQSGVFVYSTAGQLSDKRLVRSAEPLCQVWRNPMSSLILDRQVTPVPVVKE